MIKTERKGEPPIYNVESEDREMNEAISAAKRTLDQFDKAFESNKFDTSTFALKVRFPASNGGEHIWVTNIEIKRGKYFGIVGNLPDMTTTVKLGEKIAVDKENISDWMYSDNGKLRGGYTIRLLRNRMSVKEEKQFDSTAPLKVED